MFGISNVPDTPRNRIAAIIAIVLGLGVGFSVAVSGDKDPGASDPVQASKAAPETPAAPSTPSAGTINDVDFNAYSKDLAARVGLIEGETRLDSIDKIRLYFAPETGTNMVNLTSSTFEKNDGAVMVFARNNLPDDSVFAQEIYAAFSGPGESNKFNQTLAAYGLRLKCRRGDNAMQWTTELCP